MLIKNNYEKISNFMWWKLSSESELHEAYKKLLENSPSVSIKENWKKELDKVMDILWISEFDLCVSQNNYVLNEDTWEIYDLNFDKWFKIWSKITENNKKEIIENEVMKKAWIKNWVLYTIYNYNDNKAIQEYITNKIKVLSKIKKISKDEYKKSSWLIWKLSYKYWNKTASEQVLRFFRNLIVKSKIINWELKLETAEIIHIFDERFFNNYELEWLWLVEKWQLSKLDMKKDVILFEKIDWSLFNIIKDEDNWKIIYASKWSLWFDWKEKNNWVLWWLLLLLKEKWLTIKDVLNRLKLDKYNYSFEALYEEKIVEIQYKREDLWLYTLLIRNKKTLKELTLEEYLEESNRLRNEFWEIFKTPKIFFWTSLDTIFKEISKEVDITNFEWLVLYNKNYKQNLMPKRFKLKPVEYFWLKLFHRYLTDNLLKVFIKVYTNICKYVSKKWVDYVINEKFFNELNESLENFEKVTWYEISSLTKDKIKTIFKKFEKIWKDRLNPSILKDFENWKNNKEQIIIIFAILFNRVKKEIRNNLLNLYKWDIEIYETIKTVLWIKEEDIDWNILYKKLHDIKSLEKMKDENVIVSYFIDSYKNIDNQTKIILDKILNWKLTFKLTWEKSLDEKFSELWNKLEVENFIKEQFTENKLKYNIPKFMVKIFENKQWLKDWIANLMKKINIWNDLHISNDIRINYNSIELIIKMYAINSKDYFKDWYNFIQKISNGEFWNFWTIYERIKVVTYSILFAYFYNLIYTAWIAKYWKMTINQLNWILLSEWLINDDFHIEDWVLAYPNINELLNYNWKNIIVNFIKNVMLIINSEILKFINKRKNLEYYDNYQVIIEKCFNNQFNNSIKETELIWLFLENIDELWEIKSLEKVVNYVLSI